MFLLKDLGEFRCRFLLPHLLLLCHVAPDVVFKYPAVWSCAGYLRKVNPQLPCQMPYRRRGKCLPLLWNCNAAEADDGLKVVVIRDADKKSIVQIAKELAELRDKLNKQAITIDEMRDSTFTITNIGSLGGGYLSVPIINPPEVAILGVHLIRDTPMVEGNQVKIGKQLPFSLVFDHRVVDGADAVRFGNTLIKYLEDPEFLEMLG